MNHVPLPDRAVAVCAAKDHCAVVLSLGDVYTWGDGSQMGHHRRVWQPVPKRVPHAKQAISVVAGPQHTVVLVAPVRPAVENPVPVVQGNNDDGSDGDVHNDDDDDKRMTTMMMTTSSQEIVVSSRMSPHRLVELCQRRLCQHLSLQNVTLIAQHAHMMDLEWLLKACRDFVMANFDAFLDMIMLYPPNHHHTHDGKEKGWLFLYGLLCWEEEEKRIVELPHQEANMIEFDIDACARHEHRQRDVGKKATLSASTPMLPPPCAISSSSSSSSSSSAIPFHSVTACRTREHNRLFHRHASVPAVSVHPSRRNQKVDNDTEAEKMLALTQVAECTHTPVNSTSNGTTTRPQHSDAQEGFHEHHDEASFTIPTRHVKKKKKKQMRMTTTTVLHGDEGSDGNDDRIESETIGPPANTGRNNTHRRTQPLTLSNGVLSTEEEMNHRTLATTTYALSCFIKPIQHRKQQQRQEQQQQQQQTRDHRGRIETVATPYHHSTCWLRNVSDVSGQRKPMIDCERASSVVNVPSLLDIQVRLYTYIYIDIDICI